MGEFTQFCENYSRIKAAHAPNFVGTRVQVKSDLVEWDRRLKSFNDTDLCKFLLFGWPSGYLNDYPPALVDNNHLLAKQHLEHVRKFIHTELEHQAILGPFNFTPFEPWFRVSPIMMKPKRESDDRRIILDLSFPKGEGVYAGKI